MLQLTFNPGLTLTGFRTTRPWCYKLGCIETRPDVKFSLYLKKAGLATQNIVHLKKNYPMLCRFLLLYFSFYM